MSFLSLLTGTCQIQRKSSSEDSSLGEIPVWVSDPPIPCLTQPIAAHERMLFAQRNVIISDYIYVAVDPGTSNRDRVIDNLSGNLYRIVSLFNMGGQYRAWCLQVLRVEGR